MSAEAFSVSGQQLVLATGNYATFDHPIKQVLDFGDVLVVMLEVPPGTRYNENVFGVNQDGKVLWRVPHFSTRYAHAPYISMARVGNVVAIGKAEGLEVDLDPFTGIVLKKELRRF